MLVHVDAHIELMCDLCSTRSGKELNQAFREGWVQELDEDRAVHIHVCPDCLRREHAE